MQDLRCALPPEIRFIGDGFWLYLDSQASQFPDYRNDRTIGGSSDGSTESYAGFYPQRNHSDEEDIHWAAALQVGRKEGMCQGGLVRFDALSGYPFEDFLSSIGEQFPGRTFSTNCVHKDQHLPARQEAAQCKARSSNLDQTNLRWEIVGGIENL